MSDLTAAYDRLARGWTHEELADRYHDAKRRGAQLPECDQDHLIRRPIVVRGDRAVLARPPERVLELLP